MILKIYTDESLTELKREAETDKLKIPYRVSIAIIKSLDDVNIKNENDLLNFVTKNIDKLDKIIKATFGVSETELDCIDTLELIELVKEIYAWTIEKVKGLNSKEKNAQMTV